jgi:flagellar secretion chaperone FliS
MLQPLLEMPVRPMPPPGVFGQYRDQQILSANPTQLLLLVYEHAIVQCEARDAERAGRAITELIGSLNFDAGEMAVDLFRLYEYCLWELRRKHFADVAHILRRLKTAWQDALAGQTAE